MEYKYMKIELSPINKLDMKLLDSYDYFKKSVKDIAYSKDGKYVIGNYGDWKKKYKHNDVEGFVTANGIIDRNGNKIIIKPGFIVETEEKNTKTLFKNITNMLTDMVDNINNPEIVNREHNRYEIDIKRVIETANRALKDVFEKQDKQLKDNFRF
jgi:hypothetical protein